MHLTMNIILNEPTTRFFINMYSMVKIMLLIKNIVLLYIHFLLIFNMESWIIWVKTTTMHHLPPTYINPMIMSNFIVLATKRIYRYVILPPSFPFFSVRFRARKPSSSSLPFIIKKDKHILIFFQYINIYMK